MISFFEEEVKSKLKHRNLLRAWIKQIADSKGFKVGQLSYIFCNDEKILEVNQQYLQHDYYTDIITFDYTENGKISGDMYISVDTVATNAEQFNQTYERELNRVVIHGVLHLCGYKDKTPADEKNMHAQEDAALAILDQLIQQQTKR